MSNVIPFKRSAAKPHASRCDVCGLRHPNDIVYKLHRRFKFRKVDTSMYAADVAEMTANLYELLHVKGAQ